MIPCLMIALALVSQTLDNPVDADQFARLMRAFQSDIYDVSFVFEGVSRRVPPGSQPSDKGQVSPPDQRGDYYQGSYTIREDGATRLDSLMSYSSPPKVSHQRRISAILDHKLGRVSQTPDERNEQIESSMGGPGTLNSSGSPERIVYLWFFKSVTDPRKRHYECLGWENVDGHNCLKVQFDAVGGIQNPKPDRPLVRFWIDMERGGHPLKIEYSGSGNVKMRTVGIRLAKIAFDNQRDVWFPVAGRTEIFSAGAGPNPSEASMTETYFVLDGTVRFNQKFPDRYYTTDWQGDVPGTSELAKKRREFRKSPQRNDARGMEKRLREELAEADAQAKQIEASSPAKVAQGGTQFAQLCFALSGVAILSSVALWRWKNR